MSKDAQERRSKHRAAMPRQYRRVYDVAMTGKSLRAAVNSTCIECMGHEFRGVRECVSPQCPLYPYRPLHGVAYGVAGLVQGDQEPPNAGRSGGQDQ